MRNFYVIIILSVLMAAPASAQRRGARRGGRTLPAVQRTRANAEPLRALGASLVGNIIKARASDTRPGFDFALTGARVSEGKLQFQGVVTRPGGPTATSESLTATLVGTLSRARNPRTGSSGAARSRATAMAARQAQQPQGREARGPETAGQISQLSQATQSTARTTPTPPAPEADKPAAEAATAQTQAQYAAIDTGSGCEVMFLKMEFPARLGVALPAGQPLQLGVVLALTDNKAGEQINQAICRVVRALDAEGAEQEMGKPLAELNALLAGSR